MKRPEITAELSIMTEKKINTYNDPRIYWAKEVTFDYSTDHAVRVAYNTLIQFCRSQPASEDGTCSSCILYQHCPGASDLLPEDWKEIHYPFLTGNTLHYIKAGKVKQIVFARREDAEEGLSEMEEKRG